MNTTNQMPGTTQNCIVWPSQINREELRAKQNRIIEIATERNMPFDVSISEVQLGSPTVLQLHSQIWPDYLPSINSFLNTFDK